MGFAISLILMGLTRINQLFKNIIMNLATYLNPIPGMAILPLSLIWFGLGRNSIIFVLIHSVVWGLLINLLTGLASIPQIQREIGRNMGLSKFRMLIDIDIPACMPYILAGTKVALARAWRTVIAIEIVAGVVLNNAGLGWLMTRQRSMIDIPGLFSTLIIIIVIGVFFEDVIFKMIENATVKKWGTMK
jgi:NitT/TauT family transport system permease protein